MILSLKHLNNYLPKLNLEPKQLEIALNELGFEVESIKPFSNVSGVIFAKVLSVTLNPNSDRLDVVELETKNGKITIQTTNRILKQGDLVICFPVGASKDGITFKEVKLKGIPSQGMMASWSEIGYKYNLLTETDEILVLPDDFASINDDAMELLGLNDYLIEIATTANRNDANSYYFLAKELAAYFQTSFKLSFEKNLKASFTSNFKVNKNRANELSFLEVHGKKETSLAEKMLLAKHDISSLYDWSVNLTNLTLLEIGASAHVYDATTLTKNLSCEVYSGQLEILGNKEVNLKNVLTIKDDNGPISLASVIGLEKTKATFNTKQYLFEVGIFDSKYVRHGSKEIKLTTNASNQASRIISQYIASLAMQYIQAKTSDLQVSQIINPINLPNKKSIEFDEQKLTIYAGTNNLSIFEKAKNQLTSLDFEFKDNKVLVPNYRYDINYFEDIIEEIFRFYSYQNFEPKQIKITPLKTQSNKKNKQYWLHNGYNETRTFSLVSKDKNFLNPLGWKENIDLMTFVSKERESIRKSIITSLQEVIIYNKKRKLEQINIFEHGMVVSEKFVYGLASTTKSFHELKQDIINFLNLELNFEKFDNDPYIHPNVSAKIYFKNQYIGWIGKIHPMYDDTSAYYAEFFLPDNFPKATLFNNINFEPMKTIDLTFELQNNQSIQDYLEKIYKVCKPYEIKVIDDYQKVSSHNLTIRITDYESVINQINQIFNQGGN
ncbi:phenylalanine--tRNA ligase subunit beta [Mycoplasmopsis bovirhinis]|uniref:phenylalanine--tRNA ligase subunit beta n=1 Tax=Mycoplasmopsis bovirhinis TaxID=29553 RepID=UPI000BB9D70D|nr:phenylalanine--tRNA ligase subunit beta [Mycoplasmopsis bovirhinis]BBA22634.1 phenylalanine--tRNA ligase subunit beta [Mycoplasmopsis bovirhinis]